MKAVLDCTNAIDHAYLVKHLWIGFESITISGLMKINRQTCGDNLDVLNGLIEAGITLTNHLDWTVRARIVNSSKPPTLEKDGDRYRAKFEEDDCVALILVVHTADGGVVTYLTPREIDRFGSAEWMPSWPAMCN
jgi:hypothetical protein